MKDSVRGLLVLCACGFVSDVLVVVQGTAGEVDMHARKAAEHAARGDHAAAAAAHNRSAVLLAGQHGTRAKLGAAEAFSSAARSFNSARKYANAGQEKNAASCWSW